MKNTFGSSVSLTVFGESHGPEIGAILDGLAPGLKIDREFIASQMDKRRAKGRISTGRTEEDAGDQNRFQKNQRCQPGRNIPSGGHRRCAVLALRHCESLF